MKFKFYLYYIKFYIKGLIEGKICLFLNIKIYLFLFEFWYIRCLVFNKKIRKYDKVRKKWDNN